jgi:GNAT superfamily N-acetyltransferase
MEISSFSPDQYRHLAEVLSAAYEGYVFDAENLRALDLSLEQNYVCRRWLAMHNGAPVAVGEYRHTPEMYHPQEFLLTIAVHPDFQGQGIGQSLYRCLREDMAAYRPLKLRASCRADQARSVGFLEQCGFVSGMPILELQVDLAPSEDMQAELLGDRRAADVEIVTMSLLAEDRSRDRKLYDLVTSLRAEMPLPGMATAISYEQFVAGFLEAPSRLSDATFIAIHDGEYVGLCDMFADGDGGLCCGLTGVLPQYRRRGIATMLKTSGVQFAYSQGYRHIRTFNSAANAAILAVNRRAGYSVRFAWLHFEQALDSS